MAQITFYIDDETRRRIDRAAGDCGTSVSGWIGSRLRRALDDEWPDGYFELFGSLAESNIERPPQPDSDDDTPLAELP